MGVDVQPQPIERRVERLEERVTRLEELPARLDDLTGQILQLRVEMGSAISDLRDRVDAMPEQITREVMTQVRILHEDVIDRLRIIQDGQPLKPRRPEGRPRDDRCAQTAVSRPDPARGGCCGVGTSRISMKVATGKVVGGKIVIEGEPWAEGSVVTVVAREDNETFEVSPDEERALLEAIGQADRGQVVSWEELREQLRGSE
jgi:hypothetical protein